MESNCLFKFVIKISNQRNPKLGMDHSIFEGGGGCSWQDLQTEKLLRLRLYKKIFQFAPYLSFVWLLVV